MLLVAQYHAGISIVDIDDHSGDLRVQLQQCLHKIILGGQDWGSQYQHHHDLARDMSGADQDMAQQSVSGILIVGTDMKRFQQSPDRYDDLIRLGILDQAAVHRNDPVALLLIDAGNGIMITVLAEYRMYLVPVMLRMLHGNDTLDLAKRSQKLL